MKPETIQLLKNLGIGLGLLSFVALLLFGTWNVVRLPALTIEEVVVSGGETISHSAIKLDVEQILAGEYWKFIPRRFTFTYPKQEIIDQLTATPRVKNPIVDREGKILNVQLAEFEPVALWCNDVSTTTTCVFLDENGFGFAEAPMLKGGAYTRFILVGEPASTNVVYADGFDFTQLREFESLLSEYGWRVARIELDQARDVFVHIVGGGELKLSLLLSPTEVVDNLKAVLSAERYKHLEPGNFAYIDLRFGNKVFVNEFGDPAESATTTENTASEE